MQQLTAVAVIPLVHMTVHKISRLILVQQRQEGFESTVYKVCLISVALYRSVSDHYVYPPARRSFILMRRIRRAICRSVY